MNTVPIFERFVFLLFAYYFTPTQGNFEVVEASFENSDRFTTSRGRGSRSDVKLFRSSGITYEIEQTKYENDRIKKSSVKFEIEGIDTVIGVDLVLRASDNSYLQVELTCTRNAEVLFTMTTRPKLGDSLYSYKLSVVHQHDEGPMHDDLSISGYIYSTTGTPQYRYIIHSGEEFNRDAGLRLLWTEKDFNYSVFDDYSILLTLCRKPKPKYFEYFLVRFADEYDVDKWFADAGRFTSDDIPRASAEVEDHFLSIFPKRDSV